MALLLLYNSFCAWAEATISCRQLSHFCFSKATSVSAAHSLPILKAEWASRIQEIEIAVNSGRARAYLQCRLVAASTRVAACRRQNCSSGSEQDSPTSRMCTDARHSSIQSALLPINKPSAQCEPLPLMCLCMHVLLRQPHAAMSSPYMHVLPSSARIPRCPTCRSNHARETPQAREPGSWIQCLSCFALLWRWFLRREWARFGFKWTAVDKSCSLSTKAGPYAPPTEVLSTIVAGGLRTKASPNSHSSTCDQEPTPTFRTSAIFPHLCLEPTWVHLVKQTAYTLTRSHLFHGYLSCSLNPLTPPHLILSLSEDRRRKLAISVRASAICCEPKISHSESQKSDEARIRSR